MKPFPGFSESERAYFRFLRNRAETEAAVKETALLLLGELEYLLLVERPGLAIEWSMEAGKDYLFFASPGSRRVTFYVTFDFDRGVYPCVGLGVDATAEERGLFLDTVVRERQALVNLKMRLDVGGTATLAEPGSALERLDGDLVRRWRASESDIYVGRMFDPADEAFASRKVLAEVQAALAALVRVFGG